MASKNLEFSNRLQSIVVEHMNWTQEEFIEHIGIHKNSATNYLKKGTVPEWDILVRICNKLNLRSDWLLMGKKPIFNYPETSHDNVPEAPGFGPGSTNGDQCEWDAHDFGSDDNRNDFHSLINGLRLFQKITEEYPRLKSDIENLNGRLNAIETDMKKNKPPDGKEKRELWKKYLRLVK